MTTTTLSAHTIPPLAHIDVEPVHTLRAAAALAFLSSIDRVEIHNTVKRNGVVYFVLDVFLQHPTSHIPTTQLQQARHHHYMQLDQEQIALQQYPQQQQHRQITNGTTSQQSDYHLEKRFSDFADLRYHVWVHAQKQSEAVCAFSNAFMDFIVYSMAQPRLLVRLATTTYMRKKLLTTFCNEFLRLATSGCDADEPAGAPTPDSETRQVILLLLECFFRPLKGVRGHCE